MARDITGTENNQKEQLVFLLDYIGTMLLKKNSQNNAINTRPTTPTPSRNSLWSISLKSSLDIDQNILKTPFIVCIFDIKITIVFV